MVKPLFIGLPFWNAYCVFIMEMQIKSASKL